MIAGTKGWRNSWNCHQLPTTMQKQSSWQIGTWITGKYRSEREKWAEQMWAQMETSEYQDNLYQSDVEKAAKEWKCQLCMKTGERWNQWYGKCINPECGGVRMEGTQQDTSTGKGKKAISVMLGEATKLAGKKLRTFFTDASGMVINKELGIQETGWAVIETELNQEQELQKVEQWGQKEKGMPSVQKCEAIAVKEAIQSMKTGEVAHIHTDSKVTIQSIRTMMSFGHNSRHSGHGT